jgi:uncharacterized protein (TIGR03118 family)
MREVEMALTYKRLLVVLAASVVVLVAAGGAAARPGNGFVVTPLVSDNGVPGTTPDANLVNSWGLVSSATSPWWVADNGSGVSTLYTGAGAKLGLTVTVGDAPTGVVFNGSPAFAIKGGNAGPALFLFDSEAGLISAWNGSLGTTAEVEVDATSQGAIFKGLAIAQTANGPRLYATDFHNRRVDVFDGNWQPVKRPFQFFDPTIPRSYGPFGIQAIGSRVFVTYAKTQPGSGDEAHGPGLGYVDAFDAATGLLAGKVAIRGALNAPWGLAQAPAGFGSFGGDLLVGNFGDGHINAYKPIVDGRFYIPQGPLRDTAGAALSIDGLWALEFGNGAAAGPTGSLFFTAGPNDESDGLFGAITPN